MLLVNTLIRWKVADDKKQIERILWISEIDDAAYVINIFDNNYPFFRRLSDIKESINSELAIIEDDDPLKRILREEDIIEKHKELRNKAWESIEEIVYQEPLIYISNERSRIISEVCKRHQFKSITVKKYLKKYWKRGKTINALLPDFYLCGGKGKEKSISDKKIGRPRKNIEVIGEGVNVDEEIKKIFKIAINKFYYTGARNSLTMTYELMMKEFFAEDYKIQNGIKIPVIKPSSEVPTITQFRYWFEKERNFKKEISSRISAKKYEQKHRPVIGNSTIQALAPNYKYEVDATVADVYLVSRYNRNWIIGRPILYTVVDVFSRLIVGISVTLEGPSWIGAMTALANCASNKVRFCKEYGIDIEESQWPVHYLPEYIVADRGELEGYNIENLINSLHVKIQNLPPYRADWKPFVERYFNLINQRVKPFMPGVVNQNVRERGDRDYKLDAKLDIYEFTQIIIKSVLYYNNYHYLKNYNREEMMIEDDVECVPIKLWNWGIENRAGKLRSVSEEIVKLNLMPMDAATVTGKGIKFKNLYYGSKISLKERWFEKARNKGSFKVDICYDPRNMNYIYIKSDDGTDFEKCVLLEHMGRYKNKTLAEIQYLLEYEKLQLQKVSDKEMQSKVDLISEIENIVKGAEKASKASTVINESNSKKIKGIRKNRGFEKTINRENEAFELDKDKREEKSEVIEIKKYKEIEEIEEDDFGLLLKKQKEALKKNYE
ncbi:MAG: transposase [Clostridium sp.]